jgi:hypothetical protein
VYNLVRENRYDKRDGWERRWIYRSWRFVKYDVARFALNISWLLLIPIVEPSTHPLMMTSSSTQYHLPCHVPQPSSYLSGTIFSMIPLRFGDLYR